MKNSRSLRKSEYILEDLNKLLEFDKQTSQQKQEDDNIKDELREQCVENKRKLGEIMNVVLEYGHASLIDQIEFLL